ANEQQHANTSSKILPTRMSLKREVLFIFPPSIYQRLVAAAARFVPSGRFEFRQVVHGLHARHVIHPRPIGTIESVVEYATS
ncbi:MAG: hypothetical protein ACREEM_11305, partial [Blastocatellia bacterium]